jgi:Homeodomain-like domain
VIESNNGETLSRARRLVPKRHNAKLCAFSIRQRIVNALANGDSKRAIARALRVSNNTVSAIAEQEWQQVEASKARIAAQCERSATLAAERINQKLESSQDIPLNTLIPTFGVSVDKMVLLRGDVSLTVHHQHTHADHHALIQALVQANERAEKRAKPAVVEVPALPA